MLPTNIIRLEPTFRAIKEHRAALAELESKRSALDEAKTPEALVELDRLETNEECTLGTVMTAEPTTREGAAALLNYVAELEARGERRQYETCDKPGRYCSPAYFVQRNVARVLAAIA